MRSIECKCNILICNCLVSCFLPDSILVLVLALVLAMADPTEAAETQLHRRPLLCRAVLIAGSAALLRPSFSTVQLSVLVVLYGCGLTQRVNE